MATKYWIFFSITSVKIILDFLSPHRELNFTVTVAIFTTALLLNIKGLFKLKKSEAIGGAIFLAISTLALVNSGEHKEFLKYISILLIYATARAYVLQMTSHQITSLARRLLYVLASCFIINYFISWFIASPINREFLAFEHANLLGSYILISLALLYAVRLHSSPAIKNKVIFIIAGIMSTSTGAALLAGLTLIKTKRLNARSIFLIGVSSFFILSILYLLLKNFFPIYFLKTFGPLSLILDGQLGALGELARSGVRIQEIGDQYTSSLVWRFYAYFIFIEYILNLDLYSILFGGGFWSFSAAWNGIMPHNDFILIFIDFGLLGLGVFLYLTHKIIKLSLNINKNLIPLAAILITRLLLENNIYSFYLMSSATIFLTILYASTNNNAKKGQL